MRTLKQSEKMFDFCRINRAELLFVPNVSRVFVFARPFLREISVVEPFAAPLLGIVDGFRQKFRPSSAERDFQAVAEGKLD